MKKLSVILALFLSMAALAGCAQGAAEETDYEQYLPEGAQFVKEKAEDGGTEVSYKGTDGEKYKLLVDGGGVVRALEVKLPRAASNSAAPISEQGALDVIQARFPDAVLLSAAVRADKDGQVWVMVFTSGDSLYASDLEVGTGDELAYTRFFGYARDADPVAQILLSYPAAEITRLKLDFEDGRAVYKGDARADSLSYSFEVDFLTGQLLEWEMDD